MNMLSSVPFGAQIASAAVRFGIDPRLLAAVAAQETGGPGSIGGRNVVGDSGHGHGLFQIDDRYHGFARTAAAMNPQANADYAASMLSGLLKRYGGDVHKALSAYNAGDPDATGSITQWQDGARLGYADSVLRHYAQLGGTTLLEALSAESLYEQAGVNALASLASMQRVPPPSPQSYSYRQLTGFDDPFATLVDPNNS